MTVATIRLYSSVGSKYTKCVCGGQLSSLRRLQRSSGLNLREPLLGEWKGAGRKEERGRAERKREGRQMIEENTSRNKCLVTTLKQIIV